MDAPAGAGAQVDQGGGQQLTATQGNLVGLCGCCGAGLSRRASLAKLSLFQGDSQVTVQQAPGHIDESPQPSLNSDFNPDG